MEMVEKLLKKLALIELDHPDLDATTATSIKTRISKEENGESWCTAVKKAIQQELDRLQMTFSIDSCEVSVLDDATNQYKDLNDISDEIESFGRLLRLRVAPASTTDGQKRPLKAITGRYFDFNGKFTVCDGRVLEIHERPNQVNSGTGFNVWDGAILLAQYLVENPHLVRARSVLELGSGCGLVGLVAAALNSRTVVLSDLEYVLEGLKANVSANSKSVKGCDRIDCLEIDWFNPPAPSDLSAIDGDGIDVILVADCIWMEDLVAPLLNTLDKLSDENTIVIICYQRRGKSSHTAFWSGLQRIFPIVEEQSVKGLPRPDVLFLLQCRKKVTTCN